LSDHFGGTRFHFKREDLCHTGAHKLNNAVGQALLALRMGKKRIIAETGAGQHGVAAATVCARFGLDCTVYMGTEDMRRQSMNVRRMKLLGAQVVEVTSGTKTLKDATTEAIRDWVTNVRTTHYIIGSVVGPHPDPEMVRDLQRVIGDEAREQYLSLDGKLPDVVVACVGGGSNAIGMFTAFLDDKDVVLVGVEAAGKGIRTGEHAASLVGGRPGVLHGAYTYLIQDGDGQVLPTHSISAGLDYPGVGPEHALLRDLERATYVPVSDAEAVAAFKLCSRLEGILPARGAAAIEIGIPFSDPLADGPAVQRAGQVALEGGMNVGRALEIAAAVAAGGAPVVLMSYVNPLLAYDERRFAADAAAAGVAGVIV